MEVKIEAISIKLLDSLYKIEQQCFSEEAFSKRQLTYLLKDFKSIALVAKADGAIAGFIIAQMETDGVTFGHVLTLNVAPSFRRRAVATKLLEEMELQLKQRGINECRLEVREDNHEAITLYLKVGYFTVGLLKRYYGQKHGLYLKKIL